jgi:hypothetical protein
MILHKLEESEIISQATDSIEDAIETLERWVSNVKEFEVEGKKVSEIKKEFKKAIRDLKQVKKSI